ncbi:MULTISPECIES: LysR substrate-binding domain-containing protein [unclassified Sphingomonas]|uniref:LysR substrate-binding domain-containing protein n=1 Tax=Novosphingobium rhizosphaerae TaxID=1551649 RepID=UPI0015CDE3ED
MRVQVESIAAIQAFVLAAEKRSFKLAGQTMGLTPSAIGKAIQKLEEQLSVQLFHRSTRSIAITDEGTLVLDRCRRILSEIEAAQAEVSNARAAPHGRLKIGLPVEPTLLLPVITAFHEAYPNIQLDLDINDRFVDVIDEGFDAVIRSGAPADSRLRHRKLGEFGWSFVASPGYVERSGVPKSLADLAGHACLRQRLAETGRLLPWPALANGEASLPDATITATMMEPLLELAIRGRGIAHLPDFAVRPSMEKGLLVELLPGMVQETGALHILWPASQYPLPKVRVFVDFMSTHVARWLQR